VRCDSFVVETRVHYPTDINLLLDAIRKTIETASQADPLLGSTAWRQWRYQMNGFKRSYRTLQKIKHSTAQDPQKRAAHDARTQEAYADYLALAEQHGVVSRNPRNFRHSNSNPATSASRSIILPLLWKV